MELRGRLSRRQRTSLGARGLALWWVLVVAAAVAYLALVPPLTSGRDAVAVLAAVGAAALGHGLRSPWRWLVPLVLGVGGGGVLAALASASYAVTAWVLPAVLGALVGAGARLAHPGPPATRLDPPDVHDSPTLRAWAAAYGVPAELLHLQPGEERTAYAVEQRGSRWRAVGPAHPAGRWRRTEAQAYQDLCADLTYRYR